jgi:alpha-tubulin suppressor-like RCC1 family protein
VDGDGINTADPAAVANVTGEFVQVVGGDRHTCAVRRSGGVVCWGQNNSGECGVGSTSTIQAPTAVAGLASTVTKISASFRHTCAVLGNGSVQCWGLNSQYPLGTGDFAIRSTATTPSNLRAGVSVVDVATGSDHTCLVYQDGMVQCVGQNEVGQMGQGTTSLSQITFVTVPLSAATAIAAGDDFTCAVVNLQTGVSCWGKGTSGQLGNGQFANSASPVVVQGLSGTIVSIAAGEKSACAVSSDGAVRCWGDNTSRQLGSTAGSSAIAVLVDGLNLNS